MWSDKNESRLVALQYQGRTVVSYVEMARKQDGGSDECISNQTAITRLGTRFTRFEAPQYLSFSSAALANKNVYIARKQRQGSKQGGILLG